MMLEANSVHTITAVLTHPEFKVGIPQELDAETLLPLGDSSLNSESLALSLWHLLHKDKVDIIFHSYIDPTMGYGSSAEQMVRCTVWILF